MRSPPPPRAPAAPWPSLARCSMPAGAWHPYTPGSAAPDAPQLFTAVGRFRGLSCRAPRFRASRWPFTTLCQTHAVLPEALLELFAEAADAQAAAVSPLRGADRRRRTKRPGQFALDLVADRAVLE